MLLPLNPHHYFHAQISASNAMEIVYANPLKFGAAAIMGFLVNTLAYTSIKLASSLTLKVTYASLVSACACAG